MAYDKYQDLMNRLIDGLLSDEEKADLDQYLQDNPEAADQFKRIKNADKLLSRYPNVEPPPDLKSQIMSAISASPKTSATKSTYWSNLVNYLKSRSFHRYAYSFAVGLVCGIVILGLSTNLDRDYMSMDPSQVSGTILIQKSLDASKVLDSKSFAIGLSQGSIVLRAFESMLLVDLEIQSEASTTIEIVFDSTDLSYAGFWQPDHFRGGFDIGDNRLTIRHQGNGKHSLIFVRQRPQESNLIFNIESEGNSLRHVMSTAITEK